MLRTGGSGSRRFQWQRWTLDCRHGL